MFNIKTGFGSWQRISIWAILAGILYYSWPLGYLLNPPASRGGLASDLGAIGQPYNWVFVVLDSVSGILIVLVALWLKRLWEHTMSRAIKMILWGYGVFGILTTFGALVPLDCLVEFNQCGDYFHNPLVVIHGIASIGAIFGLTISIVGIWLLIIVSFGKGLRIKLFLHSIMLVWFSFGLLTLFLLVTERSSGTAQHVFITVCSIWTAVVPFILSNVHSQGPQLARIVKQEQKIEANA